MSISSQIFDIKCELIANLRLRIRLYLCNCLSAFFNFYWQVDLSIDCSLATTILLREFYTAGHTLINYLREPEVLTKALKVPQAETRTANYISSFSWWLNLMYSYSLVLSFQGHQRLQSQRNPLMARYFLNYWCYI